MNRLLDQASEWAGEAVMRLVHVAAFYVLWRLGEGSPTTVLLGLALAYIAFGPASK